MQRVDYYVLPASDPEARPLFLCRLCDRVLNAGSRLHIHCIDEASADHISQLLWEHKPEAFLPHSKAEGESEDSAPITLGWDSMRPLHRDAFVNLALALPEDAFSFDRVLEIVVQEPAVLEATRSNYRQYVAQGITPNMHDMRKGSR